MELQLELRRMELQAQAEERKLQAEERKLQMQMQAEAEREQRQFELRKLELQRAQYPSASARRDVSPQFHIEKAIRLVPKFDIVISRHFLFRSRKLRA